MKPQILIMAGIYIHIPLCKQRCIYCDFYSTQLSERADDYVAAVVSEAAMRTNDDVIKTIYIGGGTPSQLTLAQLTRLVAGLRVSFDLSMVEEFTVEVNPDDVDLDYICGLVDLGVNRVSMGVQSFVDEELHTINRRHDAGQAIDAINNIRDAGIGNVSIDLIYGIPGQTVEIWRKSVSTAVGLGVEHLSAYNLTYEEGTPLWRMREAGKLKPVDDDTCVEMYKCLTEILAGAGYEHYEISNFARPGFRSKHNSAYWNGTPYIGLGAAAHSYDGEVRSYNIASFHEYVKQINAGHLPSVNEDLQQWERYDEMVMVALRTADGLNLDLLSKRFPGDYLNHFLNEAQKHLTQGNLICREGRYVIPEDRWMVGDAVIRDLMW